MDNLPNDPFMLMSFINMKLRDQFNSLEELCDDLNIDINCLITRLGDAGFEYDANNKRFR